MLFNKIRQLVLSPTARDTTYVVKKMTAFLLAINLYERFFMMNNCIVKFKVTGNMDLEVKPEDMPFLSCAVHESKDLPLKVSVATINGDFWVEDFDVISITYSED